MIAVIIICLVIQCAFYLLIFSRLALFNNPRGQVQGKQVQGKKSSIVVCYKNEEKNIERTLSSILEQESDEVILVNDNSSDQSLELLNKYITDQVKVISNPQKFKG